MARTQTPSARFYQVHHTHEFTLSNQTKRIKAVRMTDTYHIKIKEFSKRLDDMISMMDYYAKHEITARDEITESLLYADSMKALDRAAQRLNTAHMDSMAATQK